MRRCFVLFSGGLDSALALAAMVRQGVEAIALHFFSVFIGESEQKEEQDRLRTFTSSLGAKDTIFEDYSDPMIALVQHPPHGYGRHLNPCIDCHFGMMERAFHNMKDWDVDFLVTGEVLGQRPMSQRKEALHIIDHLLQQRGWHRLVLRPLSAKLLPPTLPEEWNWVKRDELFDFQGRSRRPQIDLATTWGIQGYPNPAGGCRLTDPGYCERLRDLLENEQQWGKAEARLLRWGRHFRLRPGVKIIVGRNEEENTLLERSACEGTFFYSAIERPGALVLLCGERTEEDEKIAAGLAIHFSKHKERWAPVSRRCRGKEEEILLPHVERVDPTTLHWIGR